MCLACAAATVSRRLAREPSARRRIKRAPRRHRTKSKPLPAPLIEVHSHVFNGKDLPVENIFRIVFCGCYPPQEEEALLSPRCVGCAIAALGLSLVKQFAPSAEQERDELRKGKPSTLVPPTGLSIEQFELVIDALLGEPPRSEHATGLRELFDQVVARQAITSRAVEKLKDTIRREAKLDKRPLAEQNMRAAAVALSESPESMGVGLRWIGLFLQRRGALLDRLQEFYTSAGLETGLLVPAMVDLSKWLNEEIASHSTFALQIEVMGLLSRRPTGPPMHGFVSFDPMRAVFHRHDPDQINPLELVKQAINDHGFLGVKLYPPMGFISLQNTKHRPSKFAYYIVKGLPDQTNIRAELDDVLREFYGYCVENHVPIMAHASASIGSHSSYERFADPANWAYALQEFGTLRLNLAHFGRFYGAQNDKYTPTFEWHFGRLLSDYPHAKLYADLSYLEQILTKDPTELRRIKKGFRKFIDTFDPKVEHLMFGSDWTMLGLVDGHEDYARQLADFLSTDVGLSDEQLGNLFCRNARAFLGLKRGAPALNRLQTFYGDKLEAKFERLCGDLGL